MAGLSQLLALQGVEPARIAATLQDYYAGQFAKTDSRKTLGSMNDLVRCYSAMFEGQGGLDLTLAIMQINGMLQRTLNW